MKRFLKGIFTGLVVAIMTLGIWGCEQQGPAEQAGEQVDESVEEGQEQLEETGEDIEQGVGE